MTQSQQDRKEILIKRYKIDFDEFDNKPLSEFIAHFIDLREACLRDFSKNEPKVNVFYYSDGYNSGYEVNVEIYDFESDDDYTARLNKLEQQKITELTKERKEYERLKRKFEGE